jgi:ADP-ribose pyrophosphatase YjhB (NUDIX family)
MFKYILRNTNISEYDKTRERVAVRSIGFNNDKLIMVLTNQGDVKFPGGGVNNNKDLLTALKRECLEETGFEIESIGEKVGEFVQEKMDDYLPNTFFRMISHYYLTKQSRNFIGQKLDDYEIEIGLKVVYMSVQEALSNNNKIIKQGGDKMNPWVYRETMVLEWIIENIDIIRGKYDS